MRYRKNPLILIYVMEIEGGRRACVQQHAADPPLVIDDPRLLWALTNLPETFTRDEAYDRWSEIGDIRDDIWQALQEENLICVDTKNSNLHKSLPYHEATRSYPFMNMAKAESVQVDNKLMQEYDSVVPQPSVYLDIPGHHEVALAKATDIADTDHSARAILSLLFDGVFGERDRWRREWYEEEGLLQLDTLFKAVPSGGGRHPTECCAVVKNFEVFDGLYHYNVRTNTLRQIANSTVAESALVKALGSPFEDFRTKGASWIIFLLMPLLERAMWRYRESRSFRAVAVDVGHVEEMLSATAEAVGMSWTRFLRYNDDPLLEVTLPKHLTEEQLPIFSIVGVSR